MSNLKMKDFDGSAVYLNMGGTGTDLDPFVPIQDVRIQDQTTPGIRLYLAEHLDTSLVFRNAIAENAETVQVTTSGSVPVEGNFICIKENAFFTQMEINNVASVGGDDYDLGVTIPMDHEYTTGANVCLQNVNMTVDGSGTNVEFTLSPEGLSAGTEWDINRMIVTMIHDAAGDDG